MNEIKKVYQPRINFVKDEIGDLADSHNSLKRWKNYSQLLNVHRNSEGVGKVESVQRRAMGGRPRFDSRQCKTFLFSTASTATLGPAQPLVQWVPVVFPRE
jgi:hypothetical protein